MTRSCSELLMGCGRDVEKLFGHSPAGVCRVDQHGWLGLTGEAGSADMNMAAVTKSAPTSLVADYVGEIRDRSLDAILIVDEDAPDLVAAATSLGLTEVGNVPVMVWEGQAAPDPSERYTVRLAQESDMRVVNSLVAAAFSLDEDMCQRALPSSVLGAADMWMVEEDGEHLGCGCFVASGEHVGIYSMSTPEQFQRRGVGRAVLSTGMAHYLGKGATTFVLEATEAGFHLYEQMGFKTVAAPPVFVAGTSTQFPS